MINETVSVGEVVNMACESGIEDLNIGIRTMIKKRENTAKEKR